MSANVVMVTGAAGNLGQAVVADLAARGAGLACVERDPAKLDAVAAALPQGAAVLHLPGVDRLLTRPGQLI